MTPEKPEKFEKSEKPGLDGTGVIFDLDGTLIDTAGDLAAAMNTALAAYGRDPLATAAVRHLVGHGALAMLRHGFALTGAPLADAEGPRALAVFLDYYKANIADHSVPYPSILKAIDGLKRRGAQIAICTNKTEAPARKLISALAIDDRFDTIVGGDTAEKPKPDPSPVRLCLDRLGVQRAVFVGDSDTDIGAAQSMALPVILVDFGYGPIERAGEADAVLSDYARLEETIDTLLAR